MATVQLSNVINPTIYGDTIAVNSPEKSQFAEAGVLIRNEYFDQLAEGGKIGEISFWNDLNADTEPNYSNDNPSDVATPENVAMGEMFFRKAYLNKAYSSADLVADVLKKNPMQHIRNRFGIYWQRQAERRIIASLQGILADNVANDASDMVNNVSGTLNSDVDAGTLMSAEAVTAAAFTMGDARDSLTAIAVHPIVMMRMVNDDRIVYLQDSKSGLSIPTYLGLRVIEDENLPYTAAEGASAGDDAAKYTSILFGRDSIAYGEGSPLVPVELERQASQGTGGGVETIWERKEWLIHPIGYSFTSTTLTGTTGQNPIVSADLGDLRLAVNWDRKFYRKQVPFAFVITNG